MKICITAQEKTIDTQVDPRFGRCKYFIFVDTETMTFEAIENPFIDSRGGAGIQSGQLVAEKQVKVVLTGNMGPNAFETLKAAKIDVITSVSGTIKEAIERYNTGEFKVSETPSVGSKFGMPDQDK